MTFKKVLLPKGRFACGRESEEAERMGRTPSDSGEEDMLMWKCWTAADVCLCFGREKALFAERIRGEPVKRDRLDWRRWIKARSCRWRVSIRSTDAAPQLQC